MMSHYVLFSDDWRRALSLQLLHVSIVANRCLLSGHCISHVHWLKVFLVLPFRFQKLLTDEPEKLFCMQPLVELEKEWTHSWCLLNFFAQYQKQSSQIGSCIYDGRRDRCVGRLYSFFFCELNTSIVF